MSKRKELWDESKHLLLKLQDVKTPMQYDCTFTKNESLEFATRYFSLCKDLEYLINDIQSYMEERTE
jgi:hypothetical protein